VPYTRTLIDAIPGNKLTKSDRFIDTVAAGQGN